MGVLVLSLWNFLCFSLCLCPVFCCLMNKSRTLNAKTAHEVISVFWTLSGSSWWLHLCRPEREIKECTSENLEVLKDRPRYTDAELAALTSFVLLVDKKARLQILWRDGRHKTVPHNFIVSLSGKILQAANIVVLCCSNACCSFALR